MGSVNVLSTVVSIVCVDRFGRRILLLSACVLMLIAQTSIGGLLHANLKATNSLRQSVASAVVVLVCLFVSSFAWSWGPLGWLIPSETFPVETRTAGLRVRGELEHALHLRHRAGVPLHDVPHALRHLLLLGVDRRDGPLRGVPAAGDQERAHRRDGREGLEAALVLEEVWMVMVPEVLVTWRVGTPSDLSMLLNLFFSFFFLQQNNLLGKIFQLA
ncbi:sugar transport protein 8-like [Iris pallida]|uniref:Sugar transport protein 8-like n=1 Tax=Iris pallida TaxID=29817 RepID=A0AAX6G114_IRIPA|nr:sugar transport protein 8-like [Iris pallida]